MGLDSGCGLEDLPTGFSEAVDIQVTVEDVGLIDSGGSVASALGDCPISPVALESGVCPPFQDSRNISGHCCFEPSPCFCSLRFDFF